MNAGIMPRTDFRYEEFEGMLASYYLSLKLLKDSNDEADRRDFGKIVEILDWFAEKMKVQKSEEAIKNPRATEEEWGQPKDFGSCFTLVDMLSSFWRDFGVGGEAGTEDNINHGKLVWLVVGILGRHKVLEAEYKEENGEMIPIRIISWDDERRFGKIAVALN